MSGRRGRKVQQDEERDFGAGVLQSCVWGDIAVGPTASKYEQYFSGDKLSRAIEFHKTADRERIFVERAQPYLASTLESVMALQVCD